MYAIDVANLSALLNADREADAIAYGAFQHALDLAWEGARKAASAYAKGERAESRPVSVDVRRARIAAVFADGFREGAKAKAPTARHVEECAKAYAQGKVAK